MANKEHLAILKKGVKAWNEWRKKNPDVKPDLGGVDLWWAHFSEGNRKWAELFEANLSQADLWEANLRGVNLRAADLSGAQLIRATLRGADLSEADLSRASLDAVDLSRADLSRANLSYTTVGYTSFGDVDLSKGLETVRHARPSTIGIDTVFRSNGRIPDMFLRGAGVPEPFIASMKALVAAMEPIQFYSCFISYSTKDQEFADLLHSQLQSKGARVWLATEDLKIGDRFRARIDEAIRLYDQLLLVLSKDSVKSPWVGTEVEAAFEKERKLKRTVLFPIRLDDAVMETEEPWAAEIRRTRHIGDFRKWKDHDEYQKAFARLMRDLKAREKMAR